MPPGEGEEGDLAMPPRVTRVPIEDGGAQQQDDDVQCRYIWWMYPRINVNRNPRWIGDPIIPPLSRSPPNAHMHTYTHSISCDLPTLLQLATGRLAPAAALLTGRVRLKGDKAALRVLGAPMAGAGKLLAAEFPGLFAGVLRKGGEGKRKGGAAGGAEAPLLLLSEGAWDGLVAWKMVVRCGSIGTHTINHDNDDGRGIPRPLCGAAAVGGRRGAGGMRALRTGGWVGGGLLCI